MRNDPYSAQRHPTRPEWEEETQPNLEQQPPRRQGGAGRLWLALGAVVVVTVGATIILWGLRSRPSSSPGQPSGGGVGSIKKSGDMAVGASAASDAAMVSLAATGDIVLGNAPSSLPPNNGRDFFTQVKSAFSGDLLMGNLEQTLTEDTGVSKCAGAVAGRCYAFRTPPSYARLLADAGFGLMTMANNHAYDYGQQGYTNTKAALDAVGIKYTGAPGAIAVVSVKGVRVAVVGFAPYSWANDPNNIDAAKRIVAQAAAQADVVVVQAHMGAEGADRTHVKAGTEVFLGENRGDPIRFTHAVVDAGADLVIGHGPHVMRAMEFYKGRLIAYSLGNSGGYRSFDTSGAFGIGGVVRVTLRGDGSFVSGTLASTAMGSGGIPKIDASQAAVRTVAGLSAADFPTTGAKIDSAGKITQTG